MRYFDRVPDDVLALIVRQVSQTPHVSKWRCTVPGNLLLDARGPFATVVVPLVSHITLIRDDTKPVPEDSVALNIYEAPPLVGGAFATFGRGLTSLTLHAFPRAGTAASDLVLQGLMSQCVSLRAVTVACDMTSMDWVAFSDLFLARLGRQLRSFTLDPSGAFTPNVVACFKRLADSCRALRRLSITLPHRVSLSAVFPIWDALGDSLRDVQIVADYNYPSVHENREQWPKTIGRLRDRCRRLTALRIDTLGHYRRHQRQLADLYASYGSNLKHAQLFFMQQTNCTIVSQACSNLNAELHVYDRQWREILQLGARVSRLCVTVENGMDVEEWARLRVATVLSSELRYFKLIAAGGDHPWYDVFSAAKPSLTELVFDTPTSFLNEDGIKAIANNCGALEHFDLRAAFIEDHSLFRRIADANRRLQTVSIHQLVSPGNQPQERANADLALCDALEAFIDCSELSELSYTNREMFQPMHVVVEERFRRLCRLFARKSTVLVVNGQRKA